MTNHKTTKVTDLLSAGGRTNEVVSRIVTLIYGGQLSSGERLPSERTLAAKLSISRPMVREALNRLEARGYITIQPKSGAYLRSTIPAPLRHQVEELAQTEAKWFLDVVDLRKALETYAVQRIIEGQPPKEIEELKQCLEIMENNADMRRQSQFKKYSLADLEFHRALAKMTGNIIYHHLTDFLADLVVKSIRYSARVVDSGFGRNNLEFHRAIAQAIENKNVAEAVDAVRNHYEFVERFAQTVLNTGGSKRIA